MKKCNCSYLIFELHQRPVEAFGHQARTCDVPIDMSSYTTPREAAG